MIDPKVTNEAPETKENEDQQDDSNEGFEISISVRNDKAPTDRTNCFH